jgi:hypothetical protein
MIAGEAREIFWDDYCALHSAFAISIATSPDLPGVLNYPPVSIENAVLRDFSA